MSNAPADDAMDLLMEVVATASRARGEGWTVNVAIETGGEAERLTFSASRVLAAKDDQP